MPDSTESLFQNEPHRGLIRLRTLGVLRWVAIAGQIAAIGISRQLLDLDLNLGLCAIVIGLSIIANLISFLVFPENRRVGEREATLILLFDSLQLGALLMLTGGINNPFALLIIAPVTIAATALTLRPAVIIGLSAIVIISFVTVIHLPLVTFSGRVLRMPDLFEIGYWSAIVVSVAFIGLYTRRVSSEIRSMQSALLATQMALAREQKLTDLGGVIAAAAHELGTPLATIKLVSAEMIGELDEGTELHDDAVLIRDQANRCRDILRSMGRAGKDDLLLRQAPLSAVIEEAAEPHLGRGKEIIIQTGRDNVPVEDQPIILRRPEIIHGLRNLIQNAVDFASTTVWVEACWTDTTISVRIIDDGAGYPPHLLGRIGDPFIRKGRRQARDQRRPEYEGMGLGLFIAKTLIERTGAEFNFANGTNPYTGLPQPGEQSGAIAELVWQRGGSDGIEAPERTPVLGENLRFQS